MIIHKMNNLQLGKMYLVKHYFWFLFPTKELLGRVWTDNGMLASDGGPHAQRWTKRYSEQFKRNVGVVEKNTCFVLLERDFLFEQDKDFCFKVLDSNGNIGWIWCTEFSVYFELVKE